MDTSPTSFTEAIRNGVARANQKVENLDWFEVMQTRRYLADGHVAPFQVQLKIGFRLQDR